MTSTGPAPYGYEPRFTPEELARRRAAFEAAAAEAPPDRNPASPPAEPDRMAHNEWCSCGNCQPIDSPVQCVCCWDVDNCDRFLADLDEDGAQERCVTGHIDLSKNLSGEGSTKDSARSKIRCSGSQGPSSS